MAEKVIIIGSGPAGWSAAIYTARANLEPLVFEGAVNQENNENGTLPLGQLNLTTEVENYPGFPSGEVGAFVKSAVDEKTQRLFDIHDGPHAVTGPELMNLMRQQAKNFGTRVVTDDVVEVDFSQKPYRVKPRDGEWHEAHTVIIATGARANYLGLDSETAYKNRGVSACAVCDGALPLFKDKPLVVVGGGDSAVEEATYLTKYGSKVYIVHRRDQLRASQIMQDRALNHDKIEMVWNSTVEEVVGNDQQLTGVKVQDVNSGESRTLEASGMFLAIGHTPNTAFLNGQLAMKDSGYIEWTKSFRTHTSVEGVFAAGDVADDHYKQAITSAGTGCMAALDAEHYLTDNNLS